ncbi:CGNR zinc finger domain-containing protein [Solihabitans fulvus]|uniref:CGNR zinc finger domain-containing protein n=1 Tax=Solihabitans fulvus TaxID=1892852 RepID=A0A5B2XAC6_9PSEU|nr:CGNR zinc finger domain-containing protein [Solihabitans fulvus]KAA2260070.1 CGNR zinc finger domain-containing protein [Solihabitans fulvus]
MRQDWVWDGGQPSVSLVNTLRDRSRRRRDLLLEPADLAEWFELAGLLAEPARVTADHLASARELREAVDRTSLALAAGRPVDRADLRVINRHAWAHRQPPPQLRMDADGVLRAHRAAVGDPVAAALGAVAADAVALLAEPDRPRVQVCAAEDCDIRFVDDSPAGNRRWCSRRHAMRRMRSA